MRTFWIVSEGRLNSKSHRIIEKVKRLIEQGEKVKLVVVDPLVGEVIGMGVPAENVRRLSLVYHEKTEGVLKGGK